MQPFNKSSHAPVGTAFFLVLGLAILPFSLRFAGIQLPISPKLSGATDAWQQISEVFVANKFPVVADLAENREDAGQPSNSEDTADSVRQLACNGDIEKECDTFGDISTVEAAKAVSPRRVATGRAKRVKVTKQPVASIVVAGSEIKQMALNALNALNISGEKRFELKKAKEFQLKAEILKNINIQLFNDAFPVITPAKNSTVPKNMKMTVRVKRVASAAGESTAQCKVFSAMALERRRQCDRAALINLPVVNVDNSEF
jgi:hypothetical protein